MGGEKVVLTRWMHAQHQDHRDLLETIERDVVTSLNPHAASPRFLVAHQVRRWLMSSKTWKSASRYFAFVHYALNSIRPGIHRPRLHTHPTYSQLLARSAARSRRRTHLCTLLHRVRGDGGRAPCGEVKASMLRIGSRAVCKEGDTRRQYKWRAGGRICGQ